MPSSASEYDPPSDPTGETGWRPPEVLPSPPPCGWSTGFIATPRTVGRTPFQRIRPALPQLMFDCSALPTSPMVARQRTSTRRISPDGIRRWAMVPSFASSCTEAPAERANFAPPPGRSSMAWIVVPTGMLRSGRLLPGLMSAPGPFSIRSPCDRPRRGDDVALLAVRVVQQRDARGAVGVVLDVRDLGRHAVLVVTTEVDHAVGALVAATLVANGHTTGVVTAALAVQRADQRLLRRGPRDLDKVGDAGATTARGRRLVLADTHFSVLGDSGLLDDPASVRRPGRRRCRYGRPRRGSRWRAWCRRACRNRCGCACACPAG